MNVFHKTNSFLVLFPIGCTHTHTHTHSPGGGFGVVHSQQPTRDHVVKLEANQGIMITREGGGASMGKEKGEEQWRKGKQGKGYQKRKGEGF